MTTPLSPRAILLLFVLALTLVSPPITAQPTPSNTPKDPNDLQQALQAYTDAGHTRAAVAWRLNADGSEELASIGIDLPTDDARFEAGSITKVFTAILLADRVLEGHVRLDTPIAELLPARCDPAPEVGAITLKELSTHTSGLPRVAMSGPGLRRLLLNSSDPYRGATRQEIFQAICALSPTDLSAKGTIAYSNLGVALLGRLLERVDPTNPDATYEELIATRVLQPLSLDQSDFEARHPHTHPGHRTNHTPTNPWHLDAYNPAGGLRTTLPDLRTFAQKALAADFPPLALTLEPQHFDDEGNPEVGLGWFFQTITPESTDASEATETLIWHNGRTGGYFSYIGIAPESGRAIVLLTDTSHQSTFGADLLRSSVPDSPPLDPNIFFLVLGLVFPWLAPMAVHRLRHRLTLKLSDEPKETDEPDVAPDASFFTRLGARLNRPRPAGRLDVLTVGLEAAFYLLLTYQLGAWQAVPIAIWYVALALTLTLALRLLPDAARAPWFPTEGWKSRAATLFGVVLGLAMVAWLL